MKLFQTVTEENQFTKSINEENQLINDAPTFSGRVIEDNQPSPNPYENLSGRQQQYTQQENLNETPKITHNINASGFSTTLEIIRWPVE